MQYRNHARIKSALFSSVKQSTYFVTLLEALCLDARVRVRVHCNTRLVLGSKHIVHLADELLVLSPDLTGEEGHSVAEAVAMRFQACASGSVRLRYLLSRA